MNERFRTGTLATSDETPIVLTSVVLAEGQRRDLAATARGTVDGASFESIAVTTFENTAGTVSNDPDALPHGGTFEGQDYASPDKRLSFVINSTAVEVVFTGDPATEITAEWDLQMRR